MARREFAEETGLSLDVCAPGSKPFPLGSIVQKGGKRVEAWAVEGAWPAGRAIESNHFEMEWPPRSGRMVSFPEVDQGRFFTLAQARVKLNPAQVELLDRLVGALEASAPSHGKSD